MSRGIRVNTQWNRAENTITGDTGSAQQTLLSYRAQQDETLVSVLAQVALSLEPNLTAVTSSNLAGFVRLKILRLGQQSNIVQPNVLWNEPSDLLGVTETLGVNDLRDDRDVGETWAVVPFALGSGTGSGERQMLVLAPHTKRKLARGDQLVLDANWSNSASSNAILAWSATGTLVSLA